MLFDEASTKRHIELGFYDTLKVLKHLDGNKYYLKNKDVSYYERITKDITQKDFKYASIKRIDRKKMTIRILDSDYKNDYLMKS